MINLDKLQVFEYRFNNEELENEFNNFFYKYNLTPLFTNEHRAGKITVTYLDARSIVNESGKYHELFKEFTDYLLLAQDNKSYEEAIFKILYESRSFQGLATRIRKIMKYIDGIQEDRKFNIWNIVWYTKEVY